MYCESSSDFEIAGRPVNSIQQSWKIPTDEDGRVSTDNRIVVKTREEDFNGCHYRINRPGCRRIRSFMRRSMPESRLLEYVWWGKGVWKWRYHAILTGVASPCWGYVFFALFQTRANSLIFFLSAGSSIRFIHSRLVIVSKCAIIFAISRSMASSSSRRFLCSDWR